MQDYEQFKGITDLNTLTKLIEEVYIPMEDGNENIQSMLKNYAKTIRESINQVAGSRAIEVPSYIEPDENKAVAS